MSFNSARLLKNFIAAPSMRTAGSQIGFTVAVVAMLLISARSGIAAPVTMAEPFSDTRVFQTTTDVITKGNVLTAKTGGGSDSMEMQATAKFEFRGRRLPPAGRGSEALREAREFLNAQLQTSVAGHQTSIQLPADRYLTVASSRREGIFCYSLEGPLTRDAADLLEMPGDPLALVALLPNTPVEVGEEWTPEDWILQLLTGIEAVETSELRCKLDQATAATAKVTFEGTIKGQRLGTNTTVTITGGFLFDLKNQYLTQARISSTVKGDIGAVNPGLDLTISSSVNRKVSETPGRLTDALIETIPLEPADEQVALSFQAKQWGLQIRHSRDWHLFQAVMDGGAPVAIFRLMELGSLVAQCNISPAPTTAPGQATPLQQFEGDIQRSLGQRFGEISSREEIPLSDGRKMFRVQVNGKVTLKSAKGEAEIPMTWIYYLVTNSQGRQASFVFSVEPVLLEQLGNRDREIVQSLDFTSASR